MHKKSLYEPAPENPSPVKAKSLAQGSISSSPKSTTVPKIKQGISERSQKAIKDHLASTLRTTEKSTIIPKVVCHAPPVVHSYLRSEEGLNKEIAFDTVPPPHVLVTSNGQKSNVLRKESMGENNDVFQRDTSVRKKTSSSRKVFVESRYKKVAANLTVGTSMNTTAKSRTIDKSLQGSYISQSTPVLTKHKPGKTSTPTSKTAPGLEWNSSAIVGNQGNSAEESRKKKGSVAVQDVDDNEDFEDDLDLLYARYMQWHYMNTRVKHCTDQKSRKAAAELMFLHGRNKELRNEVDELEITLLKLQHKDQLQKQIELQTQALGPVVDKLPSIQEKYLNLLENLDTTRHILPLEEIVAPDPHQLKSTLEDTRNLLGQINILTHTKATGAAVLSETLEELSRSCTEEARLIPEAKKLFEEESLLVLKEASLLSQLKDSSVQT